MHTASHLISRHAHEGVVIGDDIQVTVLRVAADHVRLAISSPRSVPAYWEQTLYVKPAETSDDAGMREPLSVGSLNDWK